MCNFIYTLHAANMFLASLPRNKANNIDTTMHYKIWTFHVYHQSRTVILSLFILVECAWFGVEMLAKKLAPILADVDDLAKRWRMSTTLVTQ